MVGLIRELKEAVVLLVESLIELRRLRDSIAGWREVKEQTLVAVDELRVHLDGQKCCAPEKAEDEQCFSGKNTAARPHIQLLTLH